LVPQDHLALKDYKVYKDFKEFKDHKDHRVPVLLEIQAGSEILEIPALKELRVLKDQLGLREQLDLSVL
jgi:hypothetical protein